MKLTLKSVRMTDVLQVLMVHTLMMLYLLKKPPQLSLCSLMVFCMFSDTCINSGSSGLSSVSTVPVLRCCCITDGPPPECTMSTHYSYWP